MVKNKQHVEGGQVLLIDEKVPVKVRPYIEKKIIYPEAPVISATQAEKLRPKRELSEKQKENLKKLIERNRLKWAQKKNDVEHFLQSACSLRNDLEKVSFSFYL